MLPAGAKRDGRSRTPAANQGRRRHPSPDARRSESRDSRSSARRARPRPARWTECPKRRRRTAAIDAALRRNGLTPEQTGIAAYSVAHDIAAEHLGLGLTVVADAVNPVAEARTGWRDLAQTYGSRHVVIETVCPDVSEHRRRVDPRPADVPGQRIRDGERSREVAHHTGVKCSTDPCLSHWARWDDRHESGDRPAGRRSARRRPRD
jgi:predicted kinase